MDAELKDYLDNTFTSFARQMDDKITTLAKRTDDKITGLEQHILHEMDTRFTIMDKRLESIDSRLKLQAGLSQSGARAIARLSEYSESSESRYVDLPAKFDNLERRVNKLEVPRHE